MTRRRSRVLRPDHSRFGLHLLAAFAFLTPALLGAVPPPPEPTEAIRGPDTLCAARFALRLRGGEVAQRYMADFWVVTSAELEFGVRTDLPVLLGRTDHVVLPGLGAGERQRVREWPGNRYRGWVYAFPLADGATLRITSDHFRGTDADRPLLSRILVGAARDALCASRG